MQYLLEKTVKICRKKSAQNTFPMFTILWYSLKHFGMYSGTTQSRFFLFMVEFSVQHTYALWHAQWHHTVSFLSLFPVEFSVQHTYSMNYRPRDSKQLIVLGSSFFFFKQNSATKVPRWQHQTEGCSVKFSLQPKPKFKMPTLHIREYTGMSCTWVWAAQQVGKDRALLGLGLQSVNPLNAQSFLKVCCLT
jgi:hypothetical protein